MKILVAIALVSACSSDDGTSLPACHDCGPGAVSDGQFTACPLIPGPVVANRQGTVVRQLCRSFSWLGPTFETEAEASLDQDAAAIALDDAGGTAVVLGSFVDGVGPNNDGAVVGFGPDHEQAWRVAIGPFSQPSLAASPSMIALVTDVQHVGGTPVPPTDAAATLIALRPSDGSVAWQRPLAVSPVFAPDGTLLIAGEFAHSLDLGGTSAPLTATDHAGYIAALDAATGTARWAVALPDLDSLPTFAVAMSAAPSGEVAIKIESFDTHTSTSTDEVMLLDASGTVMWRQPANPEPLPSIVTDGVHIFDADTARTTSGMVVSTFSRYSATGLDWRRPIISDGTIIAGVRGLAGDHVIASIDSNGNTIGGPPPSIALGDVTWTGNGLALVDLVP